MYAKNIPKPKYALKVESFRCRGCGLCELACSIIHENEATPASSRIRVEKDRDNYKFTPSVCDQCVEANCISACPTKAIRTEKKTGARIIDEQLCINCGACARACPKASTGNAIFPHPSRKVHIKCDLCYWRDNGPICAEICPTNAIFVQRFREEEA
jgi:carbon-monoxide dehydrogenase iron sulfur subunit